ncbi:hypothetical protein COXBURSA331_A2136 [Coxiella burnetii RSA 331]|nr:hypothetical protein COXBURSA331_A2136 [Coxiella burnetii RSA 331]
MGRLYPYPQVLKTKNLKPVLGCFPLVLILKNARRSRA